MVRPLLGAIAGLTLFLYGMALMTGGLRDWAGEQLQSFLRRATARHARGLMAGGLLGALIQSSAGTVVMAGLAHAGLLNAAQSLPLILGLNIGTTLAVQFIAFRLADWAAIPLAIGALLFLTGGGSRRRPLGAALLGIGLIFLGLSLLSDPMRPYRETLGRWLSHFDGASIGGLVAGTVASLVVTAIVQSSSAVIGMVIALVSAGVISRFEQAYPILIGANIGTCATAFVGTLGARPEAKRIAMAHLLFNVFGGVLGVCAAPLFYRFIGGVSSDLARQIAHANTIKMAMSAALFWPLFPAFTALLQRIYPSGEDDIPPSHLDDALLTRPEDALRAVVGELRRAAMICLQSHRLSRPIILENNPPALRRIQKNEEASDHLKRAIHDYLFRTTRRYLSRRQAILLQYLDRISWNLERIHDHITVIVEISIRRYSMPEATFFIEDLNRLFDLHEAIELILEQLAQSLDASADSIYPGAIRTLSTINDFFTRNMETQQAFTKKIGQHIYPALSGLFFSEYVFTFDRIALHARRISETVCLKDFRIKTAKLGREEPDTPSFQPPERVRVSEYLGSRPHLRTFEEPHMPPMEESQP